MPEDSILHQEVLTITEAALAETREWLHSFKKTRRRNGTIVEAGNNRDMLDTSIRPGIDGILQDINIEDTETGIAIVFNAPDAVHVLNDTNSYHLEIASIMVESIAEEVPQHLVFDALEKLGFNPKFR